MVNAKLVTSMIMTTQRDKNGGLSFGPACVDDKYDWDYIPIFGVKVGI